ncbi:universal stress protein [Lysinibacillus alkalisoli]|uniref:Universal stress protein n=1 Tax=Lysinibacillus alkalisoli TaxID=1911548 RepID=A0A917G8B1_9BACI|nr:universal stress protein [Lysinibacillus alkalisoli]GGG28738.1 universal stress protein [Lysinibacillus alkalisoli]
MYKHILVAVDGSDNSIRAAKEAHKLAHATAFIELVYVSETDEVLATKSYNGASNLTEIERRRKIANIENILKQDNIACKLTMLQGKPAEEITHYSKEKNVDIIIVGKRGLHALQSLLLGSVSSKIIKHAHCPVLVVMDQH